MPISFILSEEPPMVCMFDDRNDMAFGPVVKGPDAMETLAGFLNALGDDPRALPDYELAFTWAAYVAQGNVPAVTDLVPEPATPVTPEPPAGYDDAPIDDAGAPVGNPPNPDAGPFEGLTVEPSGRLVPSPSEDGPESSNPDGASTATPDAIPDSAIPVGRRRCWACEGHRVEKERPGEPCGICGGLGHLPI